MCRVKNNCIYRLGNQCIYTLHRVSSNANTSSNAKTTLAILTSVRMILNLCKVLVCNQTYEVTLSVNNRELLNLVAKKNISNILSLRVGDSYKILRSHNFCNLTAHIFLETKIAVCYDTNKETVLVNNRNTTNAVLAHKCKSVAYSLVTGNCYRVINHAVLSTLYTTNLCSLICNRHIFVDNTDTTLTSDSNRHRSLCNSVHSSRNDWNIKCNVTRKTALNAHLAWKYLRVCWNKQYIIKGQTLLLNSLC